jgi:hypothetical protein
MENTVKRRDFLKTGIMAASIVAIPTIALSKPRGKIVRCGCIPVPDHMLDIHKHISEHMGYRLIDVYEVQYHPTETYPFWHLEYVDGYDLTERISIRHYPRGTKSPAGRTAYWSSHEETNKKSDIRTKDLGELVNWYSRTSWAQDSVRLINWLGHRSPAGR